MRKSFVMYAEWADQIINLPYDLAGEYAKAICRYAIYGEKEDVDSVLGAMLVPVYKRLDEDLKKYQEKVDRMNTCRNQKDIYNKSDRNLQDIKSVNVNVNDNVKKNKKKPIHDFPERKIDYSMLKSGASHV